MTEICRWIKFGTLGNDVSPVWCHHFVNPDKTALARRTGSYQRRDLIPCPQAIIFFFLLSLSPPSLSLLTGRTHIRGSRIGLIDRSDLYAETNYYPLRIHRVSGHVQRLSRVVRRACNLFSFMIPPRHRTLFHSHRDGRTVISNRRQAANRVVTSVIPFHISWRFLFALSPFRV